MTKERPALFSTALLGALWFGVVAGLVEGLGLMLFQRINWARWGPMIHVSWEILWISPIVDCIFFVFIGGLLALILRAAPRVSPLRIVASVLTYLTLYDWLTLTARLLHYACILLALAVAVSVYRWLGGREENAARFWRSTAPWVLGMLFLVFVGVQGGKRVAEDRAVARLPRAATGAPNVIVIVVDTLRADHLSCYGYSRPASPQMDGLAAHGALFENAVATSSWSLPSHVSLLTGRYVFEHGVGNVQPEPWFGWGARGLGGWPTLGEALEGRGYRTGAFSANRTYFSRDLGFGRGFQHFEDYFHSPADMFVRALYGREFARIYLKRTDKSLVKRALRRLGFSFLLDQDAEGSGSYGGAFGVRKRADVVNDEILRWIDRDPDRPFFVFANYFDVHDPYGGPRSYPKPAWPQKTEIDAYDDSVKYVDDYIGRLIQALDQRNLQQKTLLVITSDHGEALGQHHLQTHGRALYWELVHVPLVIWYPGHVPAGVRVSTPVTNSGIPATILDLLKGNPGVFPNPSLAPFWKGETKAGQLNGVLSELVQNKYPGRRDRAADRLIPTAASGWMKSLVAPEWQLIVHQELGDQLYDLAHDPTETRDAAATASGRATVEQLKSEMAKILARPSERRDRR